MTIGLFISRLGSRGSYQEAIWNGVAQVAEEYQANALCFIGGNLNSPVSFQKNWNIIYDLAGPANVDGVIVSAVLHNYTPLEKMPHFYARYAPLPMINIGLETAGIPNIAINNFAGLYDLMKHLIDDHHYRRIAFIRGPECNPEAEVRYRAYTEALNDHGIPFDPDLVATGNFAVDSGCEAVELLLDQHKTDFDVIVASNDRMAIDAWRELTRRGISVPSDVAVTGFDDIPEAGIFVTPLTTIRQPLIEQGRQAARMLLEHLCCGAQPKNLVLDTKLVIRESCGCPSWAASRLAPPIPVIPVPSESALTRQRDIVLVEVQEVICSYFADLCSHEIEELVDAFFDVLKGDTSANFLTIFSRLLRKGTMKLGRAELDEGVMPRWHEVLSVLRMKALPYKQSGVTTDINELLYRGRVLITDITERAHSNLRAQAEANILLQSEIIRDINAEADIQRIGDILAQGLPRLGIRTCALVLYEGEPIPSPFSRLIMACQDGKRLELKSGGVLFSTEQLLPADVFLDCKPPFLMLHPLVARELQVGFMLMEVLPEYRSMLNTYEGFSEQIGSALHKALLQQQIEETNRDLQQGTVELEEANTRLEQFAYVASHDLQEPLRMVTSYLQLLEKRYQDRLDDEAQELIGYAVDGAKRMKQMIDALLVYARAATRVQTLEPTDCGHLLARVLSGLKFVIEDNNALITHDSLPIVMADSTQLLGVFQNLVGNAIKFHADDQPHVHISAERKEDLWIFSIRDNGIGIAPEHLERVFTIFGRLHAQTEYPGTGIGLAICRKVIERHEGRIWVESQPGEGTTFFFSIPAWSE
ncbi:MAG: substrate-binding domain-containing protein [Anaerolineae bacterium]|nr:substrate-binding domain-containing protein [Anaerolineae bacterium]